MTKINHLKLIILLVVSCQFHFSFGQDATDENYYKWFDGIVGTENLALYNGIEYKEKYRTPEGNHKYYSSSQFQTGNLVYDGQAYYDIQMKYDLYEDELIVNLPNNKAFYAIQLISERLSEFNISGDQFVKIDYKDEQSSSKNIYGFYKIVFQDNNVTLFKRYTKTRQEKLDDKFVYNVFKEKNSYLLYYNDTYHKVKSKGNFNKIFPTHKKAINTFYDTNSVLKDTNYDSFLNQLMNQISSLLAK